MPSDFKLLASELAQIGDGPKEQIEATIDAFFSKKASGDGSLSIRNGLARAIFMDLASEYILIKRDVTQSERNVRNKVGGQLGRASLRHRQRFVVESGQSDDGEPAQPRESSMLISCSAHKNQLHQKIPTGDLRQTSPVRGLEVGAAASTSLTSKQMRRFAKLARGGHLLSKGICSDCDADLYSSVYDTTPAPRWEPKGWFAGEDKTRSPSRAQTPNTFLSSLSTSSAPRGSKTGLRSRLPSRPPVNSFSEYVHSTSIHNATGTKM